MSKRVVALNLTKDELINNTCKLMNEEGYEDALTYLHLIKKSGLMNENLIRTKASCYLSMSEYEAGISYYKEIAQDEESLSHIFLVTFFEGLFNKERDDLVLQYYNDLTQNAYIPEYLVEIIGYYKEESENRLETSGLENKNFESNDYLAEFEQFLKAGNLTKQFHLLHYISQNNINLNAEDMSPYLTDKGVNPIIKTKILMCLDTSGQDNNVTVKKFGQALTIRLTESLKTYNSLKKAILDGPFAEINQSNPTFYTIVEEFYLSFLIVVFPFLDPKTDLTSITEALTHLADESLGDRLVDENISHKVKKYMDEISAAHKAYISIRGY